MRYDQNTETYIFDSGRVGRANCGIIGIGPDLEVHDGYDGTFDTEPNRKTWIYDDATDFTQAERADLADYMIAQWTAFKAGEKRPTQP